MSVPISKLKLFFKFIYSWLCWVFVAAQAFFQCRAGETLVVVCRLLIAVASLAVDGAQALGARASVAAAHWLQSKGSSLFIGFSLQWLQWLPLLYSTDSRAFGLQQLWCIGLVALQHVGSSWTRDQTHVHCTGRCIHNHGTIREVLNFFQRFILLKYS